jgi:Cu/Ag efflux protein CusF
MRHTKITTFVALLLFGAITATAEHHEADEKPAIFAAQSMTITALVEALDQESRVVTLRGPRGNTVTFTASDDVRNLAQVSVGDMVKAEYEQIVSIEVVANDGSAPEAKELAAVARAAKGDMPAMAAFDAQVITATVEDINIEANTFKLKGPDGMVNEYIARDPENLKRAEVGDLVIITISEAIALTVEAAPAE